MRLVILRREALEMRAIVARFQVAPSITASALSRDTSPFEPRGRCAPVSGPEISVWLATVLFDHGPVPKSTGGNRIPTSHLFGVFHHDFYFNLPSAKGGQAPTQRPDALPLITALPELPGTGTAALFPGP